MYTAPYKGRNDYMYCSGCGKSLAGMNGAYCNYCGAQLATQHNPYGMRPVSESGSKATASLVLGIIGLIAWFLPFIGFPITIVGLVLGIKGMRSVKRDRAIAGMVLSIIGLAATVANSLLGAIMGALGILF